MTSVLKKKLKGKIRKGTSQKNNTAKLCYTSHWANPSLEIMESGHIRCLTYILKGDERLFLLEGKPGQVGKQPTTAS